MTLPLAPSELPVAGGEPTPRPIPTPEAPAPPRVPDLPATLNPAAQVATLHGQVLDAAGQPVARAELRLGIHAYDPQLLQPAWGNAIEASHRRPPGSGVWSDDAGRFTLYLDVAHLRRQTTAHAVLAVLAPGHAALVHRTPELRTDSLDLGVLRVVPGMQAHARTVDASGRPLAGVRLEFAQLEPVRETDVFSGVRLAPQHGDEQVADALASVLATTSDVDGRVLLDHLPESTATLRCTRDDLRERLVTDVPLPLPGPVDLGDIVLDSGGSIAGVLRDASGAPLAAGYMAVIQRGERPPSGRWKARRSTDAQGRFGFSGLEPGLYELSASADGHAWLHLPDLPTGSLDLQLTLPASGLLTLVVTDAASGAPVPSAQVALQLPERYMHLLGGWSWKHVVQPDTARPGSFAVTGIGLEGARLTVTAPGYGDWHEELPPLPTGANVLREVRLLPGLHLAGQVVDERDEPLAEVRIELMPEPYLPRRQVNSDATGAFRFDDLLAGEYEISASGSALLATVGQPLELQASRDDFRIRLYRAASLSGRVLDRHGLPAPGVFVLAWPLWPAEPETCLPADPSVDLRSNVWSRAPTIRAAKDSTYLLSLLVPGEYALFVSHDAQLGADLDGKRWRAEPYEAPAHAERVVLLGGQQLVRDLRLPPSTTLLGTVREGPVAVAGATLSVLVPDDTAAAWRIAMETRTDAEGRYEFRDLSPGACLLIARATPSALPSALRLELSADAERRVDVALPAGVVRGLVLEQGSELPAVDVRINAWPQSPAAFAGQPLDEEQRRQLSTVVALEMISTTTDAAGRFELRSLPPGRLSMSGDLGGFVRQHFPACTVPEGEPLELRLEMVRGAVVEGWLRRRDKSPVDGYDAYIELHDLDTGQQVASGQPEQGRWRIDGVEAGRFELRVVDWDAAVLLRRQLTLALGEVRTLELELDQ